MALETGDWLDWSILVEQPEDRWHFNLKDSGVSLQAL